MVNLNLNFFNSKSNILNLKFSPRKGSSILLSLLLLINIPYSLSKRKHNDPSIIQESDPNSRFICKGQLGEFAACTCIDSLNEISCINAQFVDVDVFLHLNDNYKNINKITFHGNNFQDLPDRPLFDNVEHNNLHTLNLSANYIVNLNSHALQGMPNIRVLDLSNNEIVLRPQDTDFLSFTPMITQLYLRRAFTASVNRTRQFTLMMKLFTNANLQNLQYLDLSYNYFTSIPYNLPCLFPSLSMLDLQQNIMDTISVNTTCLQTIDSIDLSRNHFNTLDDNFMKNFGNHMSSDTVILRNSFFCDCNSAKYIQWIRSTNIIREKNLLTCSRASPASFLGARLVEVPLHKLDCSTPLKSSSSSIKSLIIILPIFVLLLL